MNVSALSDSASNFLFSYAQVKVKAAERDLFRLNNREGFLSRFVSYRFAACRNRHPYIPECISNIFGNHWNVCVRESIEIEQDNWTHEFGWTEFLTCKILHGIFK